MQNSTFFQDHLEKATKRVTQEALEQGLEQGLEEGLEQGLRQGIEQGSKAAAIRHILIVLKTKFSPDIVNALTPAIENINDVERLEALLPAAVEAQNLDMFLKTLGAQVNSQNGEDTPEVL